MAQTAYLYDDIFLQHDTGWDHPECPERLTAINKKISNSTYYNQLLKVKPEKPKIHHIEEIHTPSYVRRVQKEIESGALYIDTMDTVVCPASFEAALMAVGGCLKTSGLIANGEIKNAFCAVRPPVIMRKPIIPKVSVFLIISP